MLDERFTAAMAVISKVRATIVERPGQQEQLAAAIAELDAVWAEARPVVPPVPVEPHWLRQRPAAPVEVTAGEVVSLDAVRARRARPFGRLA